MVGPAGPPATINREPGQARKGAAAAVTLCAGVWLVGFTSMTSIYIPSLLLPWCHRLRRTPASVVCARAAPSLYSECPHTAHADTVRAFS